MNITEDTELEPAQINSHQCLFCCLHIYIWIIVTSSSAVLCVINDREAAFVPEPTIHCW